MLLSILIGLWRQFRNSQKSRVLQLALEACLGQQWYKTKNCS
jgi:hypothetical protein